MVVRPVQTLPIITQTNESQLMMIIRTCGRHWHRTKANSSELRSAAKGHKPLQAKQTRTLPGDTHSLVGTGTTRDHFASFPLSFHPFRVIQPAALQRLGEAKLLVTSWKQEASLALSHMRAEGRKPRGPRVIGHYAARVRLCSRDTAGLVTQLVKLLHI